MINLYRPFGPYILECMCPDDVLKNFNDFVDSGKYIKDTNTPDMLGRGFELVYFTRNKLDDIGFTNFISNSAKEYLKQYENYDVKNAVICYMDTSFSPVFADVWVNRYFKGNYTPPHYHGGHISGITLLDLPEESDQHDLHSLEFMWSNEIYHPLQVTGKTFLFDSKLKHWVKTQRCVSERRTLSFNLMVYFQKNGIMEKWRPEPIL